MSWVERAVRYIDSELLHLPRNSFAWVDVRIFATGHGFNDVTLIKNLLMEPAYADTYLGAPWQEQSGDVHGPFRLEHISPDEFTSVDRSTALAELAAWMDTLETDRGFADSLLTGRLQDLIGAADSLYRLPDLPESSQHESGWIVGAAGGFHEFVALHRAANRLYVVVASDD